MLQSTFSPGSTLSGTTYSSHTSKPSREFCWMTLNIHENPSIRSEYEIGLGGYFSKSPITSGPTNSVRSSSQESPSKENSDKKNNNATTKIGPIATLTLTFELFCEESPRTCENFLRLCDHRDQLQQDRSTSERKEVMYEGTTVELSYKGTFFHKIIPGYFAQGGDITRRVAGGANHLSTFGKQFCDENLRRNLSEVGLLCMANQGPNTNGTQFFITTSEQNGDAMKGRHCCFGKVTDGLGEFMEMVAMSGNYVGTPSRYIIVVDCGVGKNVTHKKIDEV